VEDRRWRQLFAAAVLTVGVLLLGLHIRADKPQETEGKKNSGEIQGARTPVSDRFSPPIKSETNHASPKDSAPAKMLPAVKASKTASAKSALHLAGGSIGPSISQSNSGGINVQQATTGSNSPIVNSPITIGNVPRRISPQDKAALSRYLPSAKSKTHIVIVADQTPDSAAYAQDLYNVMKDAGWPMVYDRVEGTIVIYAPGEGFRGVFMTFKGQPQANGEVLLSDSEPMFYVAHVIVDVLRLPYVLRPDPNQSGDQITIEFTGGIPD
jgi:hypothetical protein